MLIRLQQLAGDRRGATAIEYGLIVALIVLAMVGALSDVAATTLGLWTRVATTVDGVVG